MTVAPGVADPVLVTRMSMGADGPRLAKLLRIVRSTWSPISTAPRGSAARLSMSASATTFSSSARSPSCPPDARRTPPTRPRPCPPGRCRSGDPFHVGHDAEGRRRSAASGARCTRWSRGGRRAAWYSSSRPGGSDRRTSCRGAGPRASWRSGRGRGPGSSPGYVYVQVRARHTGSGASGLRRCQVRVRQVTAGYTPAGAGAAGPRPACRGRSARAACCRLGTPSASEGVYGSVRGDQWSPPSSR